MSARKYCWVASAGPDQVGVAVEKYAVYGRAVGQWCVAKAPGIRVWSATHTPTGLSACKFESAKSARRLVKELGKHAPDFDMRTFDDVAEQLKKIVQRVLAELDDG